VGRQQKSSFPFWGCSARWSRAREGFEEEFPDISLPIPWSIDKSRCLCGFYDVNFFYREKFPDRFPAQGIYVARAVESATEEKEYGGESIAQWLHRRSADLRDLGC